MKFHFVVLFIGLMKNAPGSLEDDNHWKINLTGPDDFIEKELSKLNSNINDNILRYNLSRDSHSTREQIIKNALLKLAQDG